MANTEPTNSERCPKCGAMIALVGRVHNCRPRDPAPAVVTPKPKLSGGAAVKVKRDLNEAALLEATTDLLGNGKLTIKPTKLRAKTGAGYRHRDPEQRKNYQRNLMRKRRAKGTA